MKRGGISEIKMHRQKIEKKEPLERCRRCNNLFKLKDLDVYCICDNCNTVERKE